jgi:phenylacetate-CoA ligase
VRWVTLGAENALPRQVQLIELAFGVAPRQHYGMTEGVANASECPSGALHIDEDFAAVEFVRRPDGASSVLGTNITNLATPLIRYEVGDTVTPTDQLCPCGRAGRVVATFDGRQEDYIILPNGARVGRLDHLFKDMERIREAQIIQRQTDAVLVRVVQRPGFNATDETALRVEFARRLGPTIRVEIEYCDQLPRTKGGKLRFVVSELSGGTVMTPTLSSESRYRAS